MNKINKVSEAQDRERWTDTWIAFRNNLQYRDHRLAQSVSQRSESNSGDAGNASHINFTWIGDRSLFGKSIKHRMCSIVHLNCSYHKHRYTQSPPKIIPYPYQTRIVQWFEYINGSENQQQQLKYDFFLLNLYSFSSQYCV